MKSSVKNYFILLIILFSITANAQTTEEEFLYVAYGYKEQLQKGLDDKKGYKWKSITQYDFSLNKGIVPTFSKKEKSQVGSFEFEGLYRDGEVLPCAIVVIYKENESEKKMNGLFFCIPDHSSEQNIVAKSNADFLDRFPSDKDLLFEFVFALKQLAMKNSEIHNK